MSGVVPYGRCKGVSFCDTCGYDRNVRKSLNFAHSGLLCCDPWSDSLGWLLTAPATLYQADDSRGSLTWVQGKCNVMHALQTSVLTPLSPSPTFSVVSSSPSKCHISLNTFCWRPPLPSVRPSFYWCFCLNGFRLATTIKKSLNLNTIDAESISRNKLCTTSISGNKQEGLSHDWTHQKCCCCCCNTLTTTSGAFGQNCRSSSSVR